MQPIGTQWPKVRTLSARGGRGRPGPIALNLVVVDGSSAAGGIENAVKISYPLLGLSSAFGSTDSVGSGTSEAGAQKRGSPRRLPSSRFPRDTQWSRSTSRPDARHSESTSDRDPDV